MNTVYVLLMIWSTGSSYGGPGVVQQEFNSLAACEAARQAMAKAHDESGYGHLVLRAHGCFKK